MRVPVAVLFGLFCIAGLGRLVAAQDSLILKIPSGFTKPRIPADNPISKEKVSLGRYLFYDKRLSISGRMSCATCHRQELAFTDGRAVSIGATGQAHRRSALSLVNVAYETVLTWSDAGVKTLEQQILIPLTSENPVEMGLHGRERIVLSDLQKDRLYRELFPQAFPRDAQPFTMTNVAKAIASFERTILAGDSPYDRYARHGDSGAISESAKRGELLSSITRSPVATDVMPALTSATRHKSRVFITPRFTMMAQSFGRQRFATSRSPALTCMTEAWVRLRKSWTTTLPAGSGEATIQAKTR